MSGNNDIAAKPLNPSVDGSSTWTQQFFIQILERVLEPSGHGNVSVVPGELKDVERFDHGASLRLHRGKDCAQDFAVFGGARTASAIARNLFRFDSNAIFDRNMLMDVLAEALNQFMGRVKEQILIRHGLESKLDTPSHRGGDSGRVFILAHKESHVLRVTTEAWPGELLFVASLPRNPILLALDEAIVGLDMVGQGRGAEARVQRVLDELLEQLGAQNISGAFPRAVEWCASSIGRLVNGLREKQYEELRLRIAARLHCLQESLSLVLAPSRETSYTPPEDEFSLEVLESFCAESADLLTQARRTLNDRSLDATHALLRYLHTIKGSAGFAELIQVHELAHVTEDMLASVRERKSALREDQRKAVERSIDLLFGWIAKLESSLRDRSCILFDRAVEEHRRAVEHGNETGQRIILHSYDADGSCGAGGSTGGIKVAKERLIELKRIDLQLSQVLERTSSKSCEREEPSKLDEIKVISLDLSRTVRAMNTVSLITLLTKVARLARETSDRLGKFVRVDISGEHLEVPRDLASCLSGSLVHLARNAVDHGLESVDERKATDKDLVARVTISAYWKRGFLVVEVCDDGKGMCGRSMVARAKERGLISPGVVIPDEKALDVIMEPGFSTADKTTDLSGRGVGMDVVKQEVESAGGRVEIKSQLGAGSMFRIVMPTDSSIEIPEDLFEITPTQGPVSVKREATDSAETPESGELLFL